MSAWASSKFVPGQFTGSTGASILSTKELASGFQAWAKRVSSHVLYFIDYEHCDANGTNQTLHIHNE